MPDRQTLKVGALYGVGVIGSIGLVLGLFGPSAMLGPPGRVAVMVVAVAWALSFAGMAWRRTDEAAREAHKFAALWGAPFAMLALILALPAVAIIGFHIELHPGAAFFSDAGSHWGLVMAGVLLAGVAQVVGYGLAWAGWWLRRR